MKIKLSTFVRFISSGWFFICTLTLFAAETSWLALTSRFPMAFDEAYHFRLIQFFSHRLNPIVTYQSANSYNLGAIIQDPSFLYHYLMSFPYRFITLFTKSLEIQAISLRFIDILFALASLIVMRKILQLIHISDGLTNIVVFAFALTPMVTVLSAQINYDNLLILLTSLSVYETLFFIKKLNDKIFDVKALLILICLCLLSSLVKFSFLPVLVAITALIIWRIVIYKQEVGSLLTEVKKSFLSIGKYSKLVLVTLGVLSSFLFVRFYVVNVVKYHNPIPQCNQVLNVHDCKQYYAWNSNYTLQQQDKVHPPTNTMNILKYDAYWSLLSVLQLFGAILPLHGLYYVSEVFASLIGVLGAILLMCSIVNFKEMLQKNQGLLIVTIITFTYIIFLWARNYHDYLQLGQPIAIDGRYLVPILIYLYVLLGSGLQYALSKVRANTIAIKAALVGVILFSFVFYGGFSQYVSHIAPIYGRISPSNNFNIDVSKNRLGS